MATLADRWVWFVLAPMTVLVPARSEAQAICSAPHSSPTLSQSGAIRTLPSGAGWVQLSLSGQQSSELFNVEGSRQRFFSDSEFRTGSVYLTGAYGVATGLEVWAQVPVHDLRVRASTGTSTSRGLGDIRLAARLSPALAGLELPVALRAGVKLPGSDFPVDATELPLTEGQSDFEISLESGWAHDRLGLHFVAWGGQRWRAPDVEARHEPGDERFAHAAVGGSARALHWELGIDGLWGDAPVQQGLTLPASARHLVQLLPTVGVSTGSGRLEVTTPIPLRGRNLPSGFGVSVGYRTVWGT